MSDIDTMRWGDTQSLPLVNAQVDPETGGAIIASSQMLNAKWQRPITWRLMVSVNPLIAAVDDASTLTVVVTLFVGVGQANQQVPLAVLSFGPGTYVGETQFFDVPAETMQLQFTVLADPGVVSDGSVVVVTAMAAPVTDPRAIADVRELLREIHSLALPSRHNDPTDGDNQPRWMPPGFDDGVMRYRR
jgi:hypothetical protein